MPSGILLAPDALLGRDQMWLDLAVRGGYTTDPLRSFRCRRHQECLLEYPPPVHIVEVVVLILLYP